MAWNWSFASHILPAMLRGLLITVEATLLGSVLAFVLGLVFAIIRRARIPVLSRAVWLFIEFVRSTPLLVQLYLLFFVLPHYGVTLSALTTGVLGLGVHYSTYSAEVYRAGIDAVPVGQWEASAALSLPRWTVWMRVILPQAIPRVIPALGNNVISMFKDTPQLLAITVIDLVGAAQQSGAQAFRYVEPYTLAGLFFLGVSYPASILLRRLERRVRQP
jgi:polar amino acid transport system permease protein